MIDNRRHRANLAGAAVHFVGALFLFGSVFPLVAFAQTGSAELIHAGESLFRGTTRFANGGPACAACHTVAGLPFPSGGTMGPDLTHEYSKVGLAGLQGSLQTLFFPTMTPLFANRPLTTEEQVRLFAFLKDSDERSTTEGNPTPIFSLIAVVGCAVLLGVTWRAGRKRVRSVRHALLKRALQRREAFMSWIRDLIDPQARSWEEFYRNRWQHDSVVRSTHGVNCTGSCSWMIYVKNGIVTWEMQALDYPLLEPGLPQYEPRGCPRGITYSWYIYSPLRIKYPYARGVLLDAWREVPAQNIRTLFLPGRRWWKTKQTRSQYQRARGKGGFRRTNWDEVLEIVASFSALHCEKVGPAPSGWLLPHSCDVDVELRRRFTVSAIIGRPGLELLRSVRRFPAGFARNLG